MGSRLVFWRRWLVAAAIIVIVFGWAMVVRPDKMQRVFNVLYFSSPGGRSVFDAAAVAYVSFISAVLGAVMIGWGVMMLFALFGPFGRGDREGWSMVALSLAACRA